MDKYLIFALTVMTLAQEKDKEKGRCIAAQVIAYLGSKEFKLPYEEDDTGEVCYDYAVEYVEYQYDEGTEPDWMKNI